MNVKPWLLAGALAIHGGAGWHGGGWGWGVTGYGPLAVVPRGAGSVYDFTPAGPSWNGAPLSGQVVCERGRLEDLSEYDRQFYRDGLTAYGPRYAGMRCIGPLR